MPLYLGMDESGLGPMLGPLITASALFNVSVFENDEQFAKLLSDTVSWKKKKKGKLYVGDSKKVYTRSKGIKDLETSVLSFTFLNNEPSSFKEFIHHLNPSMVKMLEEIPWYKDDFDIPLSRERDYIQFQRDLLAKNMEKSGIEFIESGLEFLTAKRFNQAIDELDNKSKVNFQNFSGILKRTYQNSQGQLLCALDRQGGRENYKELLEPMFRKPLKIFGREVNEKRSVYEVRGKKCQAFISFEVKGDHHRFAIGLASLFAKYVREGCMHLFNSYWEKHKPGIKPTAGYFADARRFLKDLGDTPEKLKIPKEMLIRKR